MKQVDRRFLERWYVGLEIHILAFFAELSEKTDAALVVCTDKYQPTASSQLASMI